MSYFYAPEVEERENIPVEEPVYEHMLDYLIYIQQALREMELEGEVAATA